MRRTTRGTCALGSRARAVGLPKSDPTAPGDARGCSPTQGATDDQERHHLLVSSDRTALTTRLVPAISPTAKMSPSASRWTVPRRPTRRCWRRPAREPSGSRSPPALIRVHFPTYRDIPDTGLALETAVFGAGVSSSGRGRATAGRAGRDDLEEVAVEWSRLVIDVDLSIEPTSGPVASGKTLGGEWWRFP